jgi:hypothetical protein
MSASPVRLAALDASATVRVEWSGLRVPESRVVAVEPYEDWRRRDSTGRAANGYLAVGVAARCARLLAAQSLDSGRLEASVGRARQALDDSTPSSVVAARASASALAVRAAAAVVAAGGGRSVEAGTTAARLMREATFLVVFGQTAEIRSAQLSALEV